MAKKFVPSEVIVKFLTSSEIPLFANHVDGILRFCSMRFHIHYEHKGPIFYLWKPLPSMKILFYLIKFNTCTLLFVWATVLCYLKNVRVFTFDHLNETTHCVKFKTTWCKFQPLGKLIFFVIPWILVQPERLLRKCG